MNQSDRPNKPVNCSVCGAILFKAEKLRFINAFAKESIIVRCKCGLLQRVMILLIPQVKVETVQS